MSNTIATPSKSRSALTQLDKQLTQAKSLMRRMRQTVADVEDARTIERAKSAHGSKPRIPWSQVKKEAGLD
jgi:uncharacterized protein YbcC (UPF0753/DUF2309 family)